jgi:HEAT repeat protein
MLASLSPAAALEPIADAIGSTPEADAPARAALRAAFGQALRGAGEGKLAAIVGDSRRSPLARLELLRAAEGRITEAAPQARAVVEDLMGSGPGMRVRFLVLGPLARLSRGGDRSASRRLVETLSGDADWPVRAHAAELAAGDPAATGALVSATRDPAPRVQEAAMAAMAAAPPPGAIRPAMDALARENWSFVKRQAVALLAHGPASSEIDDALGRTLGDASTSIRGAALLALAQRRATSWRGAIRERLDDPVENVHIRAAAASALGALCDVDSTDRLTELARAAGGAGGEASIALGAVAGLAALHPPDLQARLAPLFGPGAPPPMRAAAEHALAARSACR